jgi:hypothetical protein
MEDGLLYGLWMQLYDMQERAYKIGADIVDKLNKVREGRINESRTNSIPTKA